MRSDGAGVRPLHPLQEPAVPGSATGRAVSTIEGLGFGAVAARRTMDEGSGSACEELGLAWS